MDSLGQFQTYLYNNSNNIKVILLLITTKILKYDKTKSPAMCSRYTKKLLKQVSMQFLPINRVIHKECLGVQFVNYLKYDNN